MPEECKGLKGIAGDSWVLLGIAGDCWVLLEIAWDCWGLLLTAGDSWDLPGLLGIAGECGSSNDPML